MLYIWICFYAAPELIVTQWDVKFSSHFDLSLVLRINSYIVGCKDWYLGNFSTRDYELIVTQWDVKALKPATDSNGGFRINSYIVGCKESYIIAVLGTEKELIVTQWDVKVIYIMVVIWKCSELIVTQWDVKTGSADVHVKTAEN